MNKGDEARNTAATKLNELSSRSHTVFRINIRSQEVGDQTQRYKVSQLNLVDLAGSEGASKTQAEGIRLREGQNINRSLLALSNVINRLSQSSGSSRQFINYRDSKLTRILQPALGGNSQTAIICTMTQTVSNYQETVNTLQFGQKAKNVKTTVNVNEIEASKQGAQEIQAALNELARAKKTIKELQERNLFLESRKGKTKVTPSTTEDSSANVYLQEQIDFMNQQMQQLKVDLEERDQTISKLVSEKHECIKSFNVLEIKYLQVLETLASMEAEKRESDKALESYKLIVAAQKMKSCRQSLSPVAPQRGRKISQDQKILNEDGIECFDLEMLQSDAQEDLRASIGATLKMPPPILKNNKQAQLEPNFELELLTKLEQSKTEYDLVKEEKERLERSKMEQQLENTIEMKETIELLTEESLVKRQMLDKYENQLKEQANEVSTSVDP